MKPGADKLINEQVPVPPIADDLEARLQQLAAEGFLTLPTRKTWTQFEPIKIAGASLADTIIEDREERF